MSKFRTDVDRYSVFFNDEMPKNVGHQLQLATLGGRIPHLPARGEAIL